MRSLECVLTGVLGGRGNLDTGHLQTKQRGLSRNQCANTRILDYQPPGLCKNPRLLSKPLCTALGYGGPSKPAPSGRLSSSCAPQLHPSSPPRVNSERLPQLPAQPQHPPPYPVLHPTLLCPLSCLSLRPLGCCPLEAGPSHLSSPSPTVRAGPGTLEALHKHWLTVPTPSSSPSVLCLCRGWDALPLLAPTPVFPTTLDCKNDTQGALRGESELPTPGGTAWPVSPLGALSGQKAALCAKDCLQSRAHDSWTEGYLTEE